MNVKHHSLMHRRSDQLCEFEDKIYVQAHGLVAVSDLWWQGAHQVGSVVNVPKIEACQAGERRVLQIALIENVRGKAREFEQCITQLGGDG